MEDPIYSIFNSQESADELRQKLLNTTLELEASRDWNSRLSNLLEIARQEIDEARRQFQNLLKVIMLPSTISNELKNPSPSSFERHPESFVMVPVQKLTNSSITESNSLSHVSSPIDAAAVSSPEFSNSVNVADSSSNGFAYAFLNQNQNQNQNLAHDFSNVAPQTFSFGPFEKHVSDPYANAWIEALVKGKVLPQQGKLVDAVIDAGPTLQNLLTAGPVPAFRNPPPIREIVVPPLAAVRNFDDAAVAGGSGTEAWNYSTPAPASASVLNFGGYNYNDALLFTSRNIGSSRRGQLF